MSKKNVEIFVLPGGKMPERKSAEAVGYDVCIRAVVSPDEMDERNPYLRKTLYDFSNEVRVREVIGKTFKDNNDEWVYEMKPHESVLVGIGFITAMEKRMFYWVAPRSGLASRQGITVTNAPGTVDPDYRGEAGVLVYNRNDAPFRLKKGMRIAQIIFQEALIPELEEKKSYEELAPTERGAGGFGSTGLK